MFQPTRTPRGARDLCALEEFGACACFNPRAPREGRATDP